jgi:HSP20 family protein
MSVTWNNYRSFGRLFDEIFKEFSEMEFGIGEALSSGERGPRILGPYVYGYSVHTGHDGQPIVREFGNIRPEEGTGKRAGNEVMEPYTEITRDDKADKVRVLAELPGVTKEDVQVSAEEKSVNISAKHGNKEYQTKVELPLDVDSQTPVAKLTNGVLELEFSVKKPKKGKSIRVD